MVKYISGTEAVRLNPHKKTKRPNRKKPKRKKYKAGESLLTFKSVILFIVPTVVILLSCCRYINKINTSYTNKIMIENLTKEIESLKKSNQALEVHIIDSIDYNYIYETATKELGMNYPSESQIIKYPYSESEYVIQFKNIPK